MIRDIFTPIRKKIIKTLNHLARRSLFKIFLAYSIPFYLNIFKPRRFKFQRKYYDYIYHPYQFTWLNERCVEIPIIWELVRKNRGGRILEVGNVLSHYFLVNHDILDKYEKAKGVINRDVIDFNPSKKYDLIVSTSTLEHVGWNEPQRNPRKVLLAFNNLRKILKKGGIIFVTLPLGYNPHLDDYIRRGKIKFSQMYYLKRISKKNLWKEVHFEDIKGAKYDAPYPMANAILVGVIKKN